MATACTTACNTTCNGLCTDVKSDNAHCGACMNACAAGQACSRGACATTCTTGLNFAKVIPSTYLPTFLTGMVFADFDADGKLDVAMSGSSTSTATSGFIQTRKGNGDGTFQPFVNTTTSGRLTQLSAADLNGDGRADLVATTTNNLISTFIASSTVFGSFSTTSLTTGSAPRGFVLSDLNGDNKADLAVVNSGATVLTVFLANATTGLFNASPPISPAPSYGTSGGTQIVSGDFNGDTFQDLIVSRGAASAAYSLMTGTGTGTFSAPVNFTALLGTNYLRAADLTGDGKPDLLAAGSTVLRPFLNSGTGTFTAGTDVLASVNGLVLTDVDADLKTDIVLTNLVGGGGAIATIKGNGDGTFSSPTSRQINTATTATLPAFADVTGDLKGDLIAAGTELFSVLPSDATGAILQLDRVTVANSPTSLAVGDITGDGKDDVVLIPSGATSTAVNAQVLIADTGGFNAGPDSPLVQGLGAAIGRLNGDSFGDLVSLVDRGAGSGVQVRFGSANGVLTLGPVLVITGSGARKVVIGDLNGDLANDLVVGTATTIEVFLANGSGTFAASRSYSTGSAVSALALGDFNADGRLDVIYANLTGPRIMINAGQGSLYAMPQATQAGISSLAVADFNRDGKLDFAAGLSTDEVRQFILTSNNGTIGSSTSIPQLGRSVFAVDFDGDGREDLLGGSYDGVHVLTGTNAAPVYLPGRAPVAAAIGRFNGDSIPDVITVAGNDLTVFNGVCR